MKGELDRDWYCQHWEKPKEQCKQYGEHGVETCHGDGKKCCYFCRRKHPTLEQYREEYGVEYQKDGAIYYLEKAFPLAGWNTAELWTLEPLPAEDYFVVCACTPWRKPDRNWRPS